ncbi:hypothetical protein BH23PLA1_BH23PLA1_17830 [soil metagenome]
MIRSISFGAAWLLIGSTLAVSAVENEIPRPEHPEPLAVREHWANLNGTWEFRFDPDDDGIASEWFEPGAGGFNREIVVPFPWESELSGIHEPDGPDIGWYRRTFEVPDSFPEDHRVWLRFGAVDYRADVWVNGQHVAEHEGGYTPFEADITDALNEDGKNVVVVRAFDPTDPSLPTGKQVGWYTTVSGIWQTVWLEARPRTYIVRFTTRTEIDPARATIEVGANNIPRDGKYSISIRPEDESVQPASTALEPFIITTFNAIQTRIWTGYARGNVEADVQDAKLWTPETPHLYDITIDLKDEDGNVIDSVKTYFGLRTIARGKLPGEEFERIFLNGKPIYIRGALDQSYNPTGLYTAPDDEFLRRDIYLAKWSGLNCLRIHIKTEEPRKLYWADKEGMLIMQDLPNTWRQNETAREAWQHTMQEAVIRDRNSPSIFAWVAFNETWGLGDHDYKQDPDTQAWVQKMVEEIRRLDPTRLVEDNSPDKRDHVEGSDINSWHFYIDDYEAAKRHIAEVVERTFPGSEFNYVPGQVQDTAPLMNSEYGNVSAGGGDRDISWGFRYLTNELRKHEKIQGYIYTELTDIEWEHNGFFNYDRSPKIFGYDVFMPDMWINELQQADFVGYDAPPAIVAKPGETISVPVFVSHFSDRDHPVMLRWWLQGWNDRGDEIMVSPPQSIPATLERYKVTWQDPIEVTMPDRPFVGALMLSLRDEQNRRFAVNLVHVVVQPETPLPRVERRNDHEAILRFRPEDYAASAWTEPTEPPPSKVYGHGQGHFEYRLQVPEAIVQARPKSFLLRFEAASKADRERVDWPERVNRQDYPQTDERTWPTVMEVTLNGHQIGLEHLENDWADARGVLSHLAGVEHGSHGELVFLNGDFPPEVLDDLAAGKPLILRFSAPGGPHPAGGLSLFGAGMGQYPIDPSFEIDTADPLPADLGVDPAAPVAIETTASRRVSVLVSGDEGDEPSTWRYRTENPGPGWADPDFDDSDWAVGPAGFGTEGTPAIAIQTPWKTRSIWLRNEVDLPELQPGDALSLHLFHDEDVEVFVNGEPLFQARGYITRYRDVSLSEEQKARFRPGRNVLAVHCRQTGGGQGIDLGLRWLQSEPDNDGIGNQAFLGASPTPRGRIRDQPCLSFRAASRAK